MTIHHASLSYGKLASQREPMQDEELLRMLSELHAEEADEAQEPSPTEAEPEPENTETPESTANKP